MLRGGRDIPPHAEHAVPFRPANTTTRRSSSHSLQQAFRRAKIVLGVFLQPRYADPARHILQESWDIPSIFHDRVIDLASDMQTRSAQKFQHFLPSPARSALVSLTMDAVRVHRAVGALLDAGWPGESGPLLRTELDIAVSCLAVIHSAEPEKAALRYH